MANPPKRQPWDSIDSVIEEQLSKPGQVLYNDPALNDGIKRELGFRNWWNGARKYLYAFKHFINGFFIGSLTVAALGFFLLDNNFLLGLLLGLLLTVLIGISKAIYNKMKKG